MNGYYLDIAWRAMMTQDEFYEKIPEWISKDVKTWNHITLMAYFCHKYEQKNGARFRLVRWKSDPGKGKESRDFAKLFKTLAPEDYADLSSEKKSGVKSDMMRKIYNYINWMFDYKFRRGERSVTGTRIFLLPSMINEFERMYSRVVRENKVNDEFSTLLAWCRDNVPEIFESQQLEGPNDLKMLEKYTSMYSLAENGPEARVVSMAKQMGLING